MRRGKKEEGSYNNRGRGASTREEGREKRAVVRGKGKRKREGGKL